MCTQQIQRGGLQGVLRGSSPCTDLSLVVRCDYVNERVNVKLASSFFARHGLTWWHRALH